MKKLIPALCLLLISALLLGTSTYAWFTANSQVSATGMKVKATSGGNLLIAYSAAGATEAPADSSFKTTDTANMSNAAALSPVSTTDLTTWVKNTAATVSASAIATNSQYTAVAAPASSATDNGYYVKQTFYLLAGQDMTAYVSNLSVKIGDAAAPLTNKQIWNSLRIGVLAYDGTSATAGSSHIYAQSAAYANGNIEGNGTDATAKGANNSGAQTLSNFHAITGTKSTDAAVVAANLTANTKLKVEVFIWFDGEDATCYTNNLLTDDLTVEIEFSDCNATA